MQIKYEFNINASLLICCSQAGIYNSFTKHSFCIYIAESMLNKVQDRSGKAETNSPIVEPHTRRSNVLPTLRL